MATTRYRSKRERKQTLQPSPHSHRTESEDDRSKRDGKQTLQPSPHSHRTESEDLPYNHWKAVWSLLNSFLATWIPYLFIGTLQTLGYLLKCIMGAFVPYFVLIILIWITIGAITHRIIPYFVPAMTISPAMFMPQCPPADEDVGAFRSLVCGRIPLPVKQTWCDWGGAYVSRSFCDALVFAEQERLHEAIRTITEKTYETVDQGQRLVIRTNRLPEPRALALRSTSLHSLQWAVLYHTNFTLKQQVAEGLKVAGESLDVTVEALIELKGDAESVLREMVDQFERIERALQSTLAGQRSLSELEETFDDALKQTDDILEQLQLQAVRTREIAKKTRSGVDHARRALSMEKRAIDVHADNVPANSLHTIFCWTCLSKTQVRQLNEDLRVWRDCNSEVIGLSNDLTGLTVELSEFRHNVKTVRIAWRRTAWGAGDVFAHIETLRNRVAQLKALMDGSKHTETIGSSA